MSPIHEWSTAMQRFTPRFVLSGALLVVLFASVACASTTPRDVAPASVSPDGTQHATISVDDGMQFHPAAVSVRAGQPLELTLHNAGRSAHDLTLRDGVAQPVTLTVDGAETTSRTLTFATPGTYPFACSMPGHALLGMRGTISVH